MDPNLNACLEMIFRWIHVVAGIAWIGHLYFFNFVNSQVVKTYDGDSKRKVVPELMPRALYWFRWGAAYTWVTGFLLAGMVYYMGGNLMPPDSTRSLGAGVGISLGLIVAGFFLFRPLLEAGGQKKPAGGGRAPSNFWVFAGGPLRLVAVDREVPGLARLAGQVGHDVLDIRVLLERIARQIRAEARPLDAAVRHLRGERQVVVDPDLAVLQLARHAQGPRDVARPHRRRQAVLHPVGLLHGLLFGVERQHHDHRAEDLALHHLVFVLRLREHRRLVEETGPVQWPAARDDLDARLAGAIHERSHPLALLLRDERSDVGRRLRRVADADLLDVRHELLEEVLVLRLLHVDARRGRAILPCVDVAGDHGAPHPRAHRRRSDAD